MPPLNNNVQIHVHFMDQIAMTVNNPAIYNFWLIILNKNNVFNAIL